MKYWFRVPTNFEHVAPEPNWPTNNKLFAIWMDDYSAHGKGPSVIWEYWDNGQGGSDLAVHFSEGSYTGAGPHLQFQPFINASTDKGRWMQLVLHVKAATTTAGVSNNDGLIETYRRWEGESTFVRLHQVTQANIAPATTGPNGWQAGYFMGWSNPGFAAQTDFYVDDVEFADSMDLTASANTTSSVASSNSSSSQSSVNSSASSQSSTMSSSSSNSSTTSSSSAASGQLKFTPWLLLDADTGSDMGNNMVSTTEKVAFGNKAWKTTAIQGTEEWAMGGGAYFPSALKKGQSLQAQWSAFFPTDFDWYAGGGGRLKFFRIRTEPVGGGNSGYHDIYLNTLGLGGGPSEDGRLTNIFEGVQSWHDTNEFMTKGEWNTFEMRVDFDNVSFDQGGKGRTRIWRKKNNQMQLILDVKSDPTLVNATDVAPFFYIFTYWNGGAPKTQSMYIDRIIFETDLTRLVETDNAGNKIIGGL
ncbi:hypothetical protein [Cellvibrio sp.]|uniref:hypothetical protein n=1 Tax=Cellvibrio sp. TaxID=1965322 RepID=UPI0039648855